MDGASGLASAQAALAAAAQQVTFTSNSPLWHRLLIQRLISEVEAELQRELSIAQADAAKWEVTF